MAEHRDKPRNPRQGEEDANWGYGLQFRFAYEFQYSVERLVPAPHGMGKMTREIEHKVSSATRDGYDRKRHRWLPQLLHSQVWTMHAEVKPEPVVGLRRVDLIRWRVESESGTFDPVEVIQKPGGPDMYGEFDCRIPAPGPLTVHAILTMENGTTKHHQRAVTLTDYLFASIGDSFASGQGNPDTRGKVSQGGAILCKGVKLQKILLGGDPKTHFVTDPEWLEPKAWRSLASAPARAALQANRHRGSEQRLVRFVSTATSGAEIQRGLIGPQHDWQECGQVEELARLLEYRQRSRPGSRVRDHRTATNRRPVDVLHISIGGNDVGFAPGLERMTKDGFSLLRWVISPGRSRAEVRREFERQLKQLPGDLAGLAALVERRIAPRAVLITEYPTALFDNAEGHAAAGGGVFAVNGEWGVSEEDAQLIEDMGGELNSVIRENAKTLGWTYIEGIDADFRTHGYSSGQSYFVGAEESCRTQGDFEGMMHPNRTGTGIVAGRILGGLQKALDELEPEWPALDTPRRKPAGPAGRPDPSGTGRPNERVSAKTAKKSGRLGGRIRRRRGKGFGGQ